jgi:hypothetical protein
MIEKLQEEYEKLSEEFSKINSEHNRVVKDGKQDDKLELALMRKRRELDEKYQELIAAQIKGGK